MKPNSGFFPTTRPPAARTRVTTVASMSATLRSSGADPYVSGIPATATWSLKLTVRPARRPSSAPPIEHRHTQAP